MPSGASAGLIEKNCLSSRKTAPSVDTTGCMVTSLLSHLEMHVPYDLSHLIREYPLTNTESQGAEEYGVTACRFWSSGLVALLSNNQLVAVSNYNEPRPRLLAPSPEGEVCSWSLIPPAYTLSRSVEVLLAIDKTVYLIDPSETEDKMLENGPFKHVSVSPTGRFVALFTKDGKVWVVSSDFQAKFSEYDSRARTPPNSVEWCGDDAVILAWEDELHIVGPNGAATR